MPSQTTSRSGCHTLPLRRLTSARLPSGQPSTLWRMWATSSVDSWNRSRNALAGQVGVLTNQWLRLIEWPPYWCLPPSAISPSLRGRVAMTICRRCILQVISGCGRGPCRECARCVTSATRHSSIPTGPAIGAALSSALTATASNGRSALSSATTWRRRTGSGCRVHRTRTTRQRS